MKTKEGDIYISKLDRNFFGAFKIIKKGKNFFEELQDDLLMIGVLNYVDKKKPTLEDDRLNEILCCNRFFYSNQYCIEFFIDNIKYNNLNNYEYLGNKPLTDQEEKIKFILGDGKDGITGGFPFSRAIEPNFVNSAFLEWRWINEQEDFKKELSSPPKVEQKKVNVSKRTLPDHLFWEVVEKIDWSQNDDLEKIQPVVDFLSKKTVTEIEQFQENLDYKLYQLDTLQHAKNIGEESFKDEDSFSGDNFLYVRCCAIANGEQFFQNALNNPNKMPKDVAFEPLLYVAEQAYQKKTNKFFKYKSGYSHETFSNHNGWK